MRATINIWGEIGIDCDLLNVIRQVKAQPKATEFLVKIDSIGGFVDVGDDIYNYLKNLAQPVTTLAIRAYSIASKIFMAGSTRLVHQDATDVIMIHLPWMEVAGSHNEISDHLKGLKNVEDGLVKFYAEALEIDPETVQSLLKNETYLSASQALEMGLATAIQPKLPAVAKYNNREKDRENLMSKIEQNLLQKVTAIYNKTFGIKNELILQDASGLEVIFPDLVDGDTPEVDSKVTVDGVPAEGEFLMPDGSTIVAVNGSVTAINQKVEEEVTEDESLAAEGDDKDAIIKELQDKIEELEAKLADSQDNDAQDKMLAVLEKSVEKASEMEAKILALQKSIGSDFTITNNKENGSAVAKAKDVETPKFSIKRK